MLETCEIWGPHSTFYFFRNICRIMELNCCGQHFALQVCPEIGRRTKEEKGGGEVAFNHQIQNEESKFLAQVGRLVRGLRPRSPAVPRALVLGQAVALALREGLHQGCTTMSETVPTMPPRDPPPQSPKFLERSAGTTVSLNSPNPAEHSAARGCAMAAASSASMHASAQESCIDRSCTTAPSYSSVTAE